MSRVCREHLKKHARCDLSCWNFDSEDEQAFDYGECGSEFKVMEENEA